MNSQDSFKAWAKSQGFSKQDLDGPLHELWPCWHAATKLAETASEKIKSESDAVKTRHMNLLLDLDRLVRDEETLNDFSEVRALKKKIASLTNLSPSLGPIKVYGIKNGEEVPLGRMQKTARMKAKELAAEMFGQFEERDDSDADLCFAAMELLLEYLEVQGSTATNAH